ncbi:hypothetical protein RB25_17940 [Herbaspirillum rubrisubalbicans]|nr:hypothetical protein RB25_17940 [Herbaspirillum rubrisubalbicans]
MIRQDHQGLCSCYFLVGRAKAFPVGIDRRFTALIEGECIAEVFRDTDAQPVNVTAGPGIDSIRKGCHISL